MLKFCLITLINSLWLFRNKGTATQPAYELITDDLAGISALNLVAPLAATFGDLDADGVQAGIDAGSRVSLHHGV